MLYKFRIPIAISLIALPAMWSIIYASPVVGVLLCFFGVAALAVITCKPPKKPFNLLDIKYPKELRESVAKFLPIIQKAEDENDSELLSAVDNLKESHILFDTVARGLIRLKFKGLPQIPEGTN